MEEQTITIQNSISSKSREESEKSDEKKAKTRIPVSRFRQTVEKMTAERRGSLNRKLEPESQIPVRRSSIPKLKKAPTKPVRKTLTITKTEATEQVKVDKQDTAPEDEFDKLYQEVVLGTPTPVNIDVSLLNPKVDDPEKLESKFEEIIHDYDENRGQPIDVEKIRKSKIPFLKRRSQQELEIRGDRSGKIIAARDKVRLRHGSKSEEQTDITFDETVKEAKAVNNKLNENVIKTNTKVTSQSTKTITRSFSKGVVKPRDVNSDDIYKDKDAKDDKDKLKENVSITNSEVTSQNTKTVIRSSSKDLQLDIISDETVKDKDAKVVDDKLKENTSVITPEVTSQHTKTVNRSSSQDVVKCKEQLDVISDETVEDKDAKVDNDQLKEDASVTNSEVITHHTKTVITSSSQDVVKCKEQLDVISDETVKNIDAKVVDDKLKENTSVTNSEVISQHTKTVIRTSSKDIEEDKLTKVVGTTTVTEVKTTENTEKIENTKGVVAEEYIHKEYIKIGIPVLDSYLQEKTEKSEIEKTIEVKKVLSYTNNEEQNEASIETVEINNEPATTEVVNIEPTFVEIIDTSENHADNEKQETVYTEKQKEIEDKNAAIKEKDDTIEDIAKLRGKVSRIISKIDTHEPLDKEARKIDFKKELPKTKSVMSRIAMFESHDVPDKSKVSKHKRHICLQKLVTIDTPMVEHSHVHTPLIVDEVFKPFQLKPDTIDTNKDIVTTNGNKENETQIIKAEKVIIESPESVRYDLQNKLQIEPNTLFIEQFKVVEEVLKPVPSKFEPKDEVVKNVNDNKEILTNRKSVDTPVIIPKFIPVREVLKRYESLNGQDENHVHFKNIGDLPKTRSISEIINDLKPEENQKSLDSMFAHQVEPISKVLKDSIFEESKDIIENVTISKSEEKEVLENEVFTTEETNEKVVIVTQVSTTKDTEEKAVIEKEAINIENGIKPIDNNEFFQVNKTRNDNKYIKRDHEFKNTESDGFKSLEFIQQYHDSRVKRNEDLKRAKSLAELDLGDAVKGKVNRMIVRINSMEKIDLEFKEVPINIREMPRKRSVSEKITLFENKLTYAKEVSPTRILKQGTSPKPIEVTADIEEKIAELSNVKLKYGAMEGMPRVQLANGVTMPALAVGTALLDPRLAYHIVSAAISLGYRAIDTAYIYGNEQLVGEAIRDKINDGTVTREELFIISKLWSTYHRTELVQSACEASLKTMGLEYFDLYLIHNPMSLKEGGSPIPKIATVLQYSESDYLDAWFGMEALGSRVRALGVSNFNSIQIQRVLDRARVKPVVNQVECHPYLSQQRLDNFCNERNITLNCFGVLGSKGTPLEYKSGQSAVIDDALVQVMASGLSVSPAQLLIRYQIECGHTVVVKASSPAHLWDNLQALTFNLTSAQVDALSALNRNKRNFTFKGMGDTHKNYPFNTAF